MRRLIILASAVAALGAATPDARAEGGRITAVMESEVRFTDPYFVTANISRLYSHMVYDTLMGVDYAGNIHPQMVERWSVSDDRLTWTFTLREGLLWHDGQPVTAADCIASLRRWGPRDALGRMMMDAVGTMEVVDAHSFRLVMKHPFPLLLDILARPRNPPAVMMPARLASTPGTQQITDSTGSGPFILRRDQWVPGARMVFDRNPTYRPRPEPSDFLAGGKVVKVDQVVWQVIPDVSTAVNALRAGEVDYLQFLPFDLLPVARADQNIQVAAPRGPGTMYQGYYRPNHASGPFADPEVRRVLWSIFDTTTVPDAAGIPAEMRIDGCHSFYTCGSPLESRAGIEAASSPSVAKAREALKKTKYAGEPVVILQSSDSEVSKAAAEVLAKSLQETGFKIDLQALDWGTVLARRAQKTGWSIYSVFALAWDLSSPLTHVYLANNCKDFAGWACDERVNPLMRAFADAPGLPERKKIADEIQRLAYEDVPVVIWGQFSYPRAWRKQLSGVSAEGFPVFWNVSKQ